jgi:hypothetical protein
MMIRFDEDLLGVAVVITALAEIEIDWRLEKRLRARLTARERLVASQKRYEIYREGGTCRPECEFANRPGQPILQMLPEAAPSLR